MSVQNISALNVEVLTVLGCRIQTPAESEKHCLINCHLKIEALNTYYIADEIVKNNINKALLSKEKIATHICYAVSCHIHLIRVLICTITTIIIQLIILHNNIKCQTLNRPWPAFCRLHVLIIYILSNMFPQALRVPVLSGVNTVYCYIIPLYSDKIFDFSSALFC